jgi:hypothetical protein|tara:strand:- start:3963 stop:4649 length:687 start_codon:yes stop_codon:yes gene_type:complete
MTQTVPSYRPIELMQNPKITKSDFTDFIGVWENFVPAPLCQQIITYGDKIFNGDLANTINEEDDTDLGGSLSESKIMEGSEMYGSAYNRHDSAFMLNYASAKYTSNINQMLKACANHYCSHFSTLKKTRMFSSDIKMQRTPPGGGYHSWHYENGTVECAARELTWMIYLNDIEEGGETEFMYQKRRVKPTVGTVVIFPAGLTHVHRGGFLLGDKDKYIVTGWYIKTHG